MRNPPLVIALAGLVVVPFIPPAAADHEYEQPVWFNWDHSDLDVLIVGVKDPLLGASIQQAVHAWETGIAELAPSLAARLQLRVWWADSGTPPPAGFQTDIAVVPQGFFAVYWGGSSSFGLPTCTVHAPMLAGWGTFYRVTSHEFGHCLGLGHVFEHGVEYEPGFDIMGGGDGPKCPSNLNIRVLERVFGGQTGTVTISASDYRQAAAC